MVTGQTIDILRESTVAAFGRIVEELPNVDKNFDIHGYIITYSKILILAGYLKRKIAVDTY